jgi:hypothetical protein
MALAAIHPDHRLIIRRSIVVGAAVSLLCAPAVVRVTSIMPVRRPLYPFGPQYAGFVERLRYDWLEKALERGWDDQRDGQTFGGISESHAKSAVAHARAHGFLAPYVSIYRYA